MFKISFITFSEKGRRENNEDYVIYSISDEKKIFIVCDGLGGHTYGEIASSTIANNIKDFLEKKENITQQEIQSAINFASNELNEKSKTIPTSINMGTTLAMLVIQENKAIASWLGDSRIYHFRNSKIHFKSEDHSLVNLLIKSGEITEEEAMYHHQKNIILKAIIANSKEVTASFHTTDVQANDYFLLCTDGVIEAFSDRALLSEINKGSSLENIANSIKNKCGLFSTDNYSCILLKVDEP